MTERTSWPVGWFPIGLAGAIGLAAGALLMLGVSLSLDGPTDREQILQANLTKAEEREKRSASQVTTLLRKNAELAKSAAVLSAQVNECESQIRELNVSLSATERKHKPLGVTLDEVLEPIGKEFAVQNVGDGKTVVKIAGGKVVLNPIWDADDLIGVHLLSGIDEVVELSRSWFLLLKKLSPDAKQDATTVEWLKNALLFVSRHQEASVRRAFEKHQVDIHFWGQGTGSDVQLIVIAVSAEDD